MSKIADSLCNNINSETTAATAMANIANAVAGIFSDGTVTYVGIFSGVIDATGLPISGIPSTNKIDPGTLVETFTAEMTAIQSKLPEGSYITFSDVFDTLYNSIKSSCMIGLGTTVVLPGTQAFPRLSRTVLQQEVLKAVVVIEQEKLQSLFEKRSRSEKPEEAKIIDAKIEEINEGLQRKVMEALGDALLADLVAGAAPDIAGKYAGTATGATVGTIESL